MLKEQNKSKKEEKKSRFHPFLTEEQGIAYQMFHNDLGEVVDKASRYSLDARLIVAELEMMKFVVMNSTVQIAMGLFDELGRKKNVDTGDVSIQ